MKKKEPISNFSAEDYLFAVIKEFIPKSSKEKILGLKQKSEMQYRVVLIEFDISFFVTSLKDIEEIALKKITEELTKIREKDPTQVPIPKKYEEDYSGKLMVRVDPELHKQLHIESAVTGISLNKLINKKLSGE